MPQVIMQFSIASGRNDNDSGMTYNFLRNCYSEIIIIELQKSRC